MPSSNLSTIKTDKKKSIEKPVYENMVVNDYRDTVSERTNILHILQKTLKEVPTCYYHQEKTL